MSEAIINILARIERIESIEEIRALKAHYLNACDQQDPSQVRACFANGHVCVDAGYLGVFDNADAFVEMYRAAACHDFVFDKHQAGNGEILIDGDRATGLWCLDYRNINTRDRTLTLMSTLYNDVYARIEGKWLIQSSRTEFRTVFHASFTEAGLTPLIAGRSLQAPMLTADAKSARDTKSARTS